MKMEQIECSETLPFKLQTLVNHPEESMQQLILFISVCACMLHAPSIILLTLITLTIDKEHTANEEARSLLSWNSE
jgi:hypothetical protein